MGAPQIQFRGVSNWFWGTCQGSPVCLGAYLTGGPPFHQTPPPRAYKSSFGGFKLVLGHLLRATPFAWVHISLGSAVPPTPPQIQFRGFQTVSLRSAFPPKPPPNPVSGFQADPRSTNPPPPPKSSFGGLKLVLGHLLRATPFVWVHISLGSAVPPKPPLKSSFGGVKLILGHFPPKEP